MKRILTLLIFAILIISSQAQAPEKMSYQAVIRNASSELITNQKVGIQISILQGSISGSPVYSETQSTTTNTNGLISIEIGTGTTSDNFSAINWANGPYFIKVETDPEGGSSYTITGTSQLLSVPYALHAKTAEVINESDPVYSASEAAKITTNDILNLSNLSGTNTGDQDLSALATKTSLNDTAVAIRADFPDVSGFISTESDPVYVASEAAKITSSDITNLSNLSGTNTGDQDLSNLVTKTLLNDTATAIRTDLKEAAKITASDINNLSNLSGINTGDQDLSTFATKTALNDSAIAIRADFPAETDPVYSSSLAAGITATDTAKWNYASENRYKVGDLAQGGVVFWVDESEEHGLVCTITDQHIGIRWYAGTNGNTHSKGDGPLSGKANTTIIISSQIAIGDDDSTYAARICNELQVTQNGKTYGDWYLPSKEELNLMFTNKSTINTTAVTNGGTFFEHNYYWSSTEYDDSHTYTIYFGDGSLFYAYKASKYYVRAVRSF